MIKFGSVESQRNTARISSAGGRTWRGWSARRFLVLVRAIALCCLTPAWPTQVRAEQVDIPCVGGCVTFGSQVAVLSNGNIVVVDDSGPISNIGAVYLYSSGGTLINSFTGASANDFVGSGGIVPVGNGNFVVLSPHWNNVGATNAGAVTWVNGTTGLPGAVVSAGNSLVGTHTSDNVGSEGVTVLSNGNYVLLNTHWDYAVGAATWGSGASGVSGPISTSNSLLGNELNDFESASIAALNNGNYVIGTPLWGNVVSQIGAATWCNGSAALLGTIADGNPLTGTSSGDEVGLNVIALSNGNYVVGSRYWNGLLGAATWGNGVSGASGPVSSANSIVGAAVGDLVGDVVTALSNGNYVVQSLFNGLGAVTWASGTAISSTIVSADNSLIGSASGDYVGVYGVAALSNGNYVVSTPGWNGGIGAATWADGTTKASGTLSASNSLIGTAAGDKVGQYVTALRNGNYVVVSQNWNGGRGAATWGNGTTASSGIVSASNSRVGSVAGDYVGSGNVVALTDGNYVVASAVWNAFVGAASWGNGATGALTSGILSASNSLTGAAANDVTGQPVVALSNGNYVVGSYGWNGVGAVTWANGTIGISGSVSAHRSLIGTLPNDFGGFEITALSDGNYVIRSPHWGNVGAVTLANGAFGLSGTVAPWNSVIGSTGSGGTGMVFAYDASRKRLAVGRPADNIVSLFTMDQIFASGYE